MISKFFKQETGNKPNLMSCPIAPEGDWTEITGDEYNSLIGLTNRTISKLEFMQRFTDTELENIYTAAKTVVSIEIWLDKFKVAEFIDLDRPENLTGLQAMETSNLIAAGRAAAILA